MIPRATASTRSHGDAGPDGPVASAWASRSTSYRWRNLSSGPQRRVAAGHPDHPRDVARVAADGAADVEHDRLAGLRSRGRPARGAATRCWAPTRRSRTRRPRGPRRAAAPGPRWRRRPRCDRPAARRRSRRSPGRRHGRPGAAARPRPGPCASAARGAPPTRARSARPAGPAAARGRRRRAARPRRRPRRRSAAGRRSPASRVVATRRIGSSVSSQVATVTWPAAAAAQVRAGVASSLGAISVTGAPAAPGITSSVSRSSGMAR